MPNPTTSVEVPHWVPDWNPECDPYWNPYWNPNGTARKTGETPAQSMQKGVPKNPDTFFYNATHPLGGVG